MDSTRLRNTLRYLANEDDEEYDHLDEEEQEKLIASFRKQDEDRTALYTKIFLGITLVLPLTYLPYLLTSHTAHTFLLCLLSITSLLSTAYMLAYLPPRKPDPKGKRVIRGAGDGPIKRYLGSSNGGVCAVLVVASWSVGWWGKGDEGGLGVMCLVPGLVLGVVAMARRLVLSVDVDELEGLRYHYKGP